MRIQPRLGSGHERIDSSASLMKSIRRQIELIAARHNCSKSFVIATLLAKQLGIEEQVYYDEKPERNKGRTDSRRSSATIARFEQRKRNLA